MFLFVLEGFLGKPGSGILTTHCNGDLLEAMWSVGATGRAFFCFPHCIQHLRVDVIMERGRAAPRVSA